MTESFQPDPPATDPPAADLLVVGAGIAGTSLAYHAAHLGLSVCVVDAGKSAASGVPSALLNPVRGQSGKVPQGAVQGLTHTWALVRALEAAGHTVPHGEVGVVRPIPDARTLERFERNLQGAEDLPRKWLAAGAVAGLAGERWHAALHLPQGGWLDGAAFCAALLAASGARVVRGHVRQASVGAALLADGRTLRARAVALCGGSLGAALLPTTADQQTTPTKRYRAGTLLMLRRAPVPVPLSFGVYAAPARSGGGVLGATFEAPAAVHRPERLPLRSLAWLLRGGERLTSLQGLEVTGQWAGTRLSGLQVGQAASGMYTLTGLGSKGFLLGPWLARRLADEIARELAEDASQESLTQKPPT